MTRTIRLPAVLALVWLSGAALSASAQEILEFRIPTPGSRPLDITPGPGGMWFTEDGASRIGRVTPSGEITEFPIHRTAVGIVAGSDGNLWITSDGFLSRVTPGGEVTDFPIAGRGFGITGGLDRDLWFTEIAHFPDNAGYLGHATVSGQITEVRIHSWAEDVLAAPDGNLWLPDWTEVGYDAIVRVTPAGQETRFGLPGGLNAPGDVGPAALAFGPDGNVWFTQARVAQIGRVTPSGEVTEFNVGSNPRGITLGPGGQLWFTEWAANKIAHMTAAGHPVEIPVPTAEAQPWAIAAGADGSIWFTETNAGRIGTISAHADAGSCAENTLCLADNRFHVDVDWESTTASGTGHPALLTPNTGSFWFFGSENVEMLVKVLDACAEFGHQWVFAGGLTNVRVTMTVIDVLTGQSQSYVNPQGTAFLPIQDTRTFSTCP